jgi:hypothetical protein
MDDLLQRLLAEERWLGMMIPARYWPALLACGADAGVGHDGWGATWRVHVFCADEAAAGALEAAGFARQPRAGYWVATYEEAPRGE